MIPYASLNKNVFVMKIEHFLHILRANGRYHFTLKEAMDSLQAPYRATLLAISRQRQKRLIVDPAKGFYLIIPPEYQAYGCLPADMFIDNLMHYWEMPYYVSLLTAAQYYDAAHQKPQQFQVMTSVNRRTIQCGRISITFIARRNTNEMPIKSFNTFSGTMKVATPETLVLDLIKYPKHSNGISNIATIIKELADKLNPNQLSKLIDSEKETALVQRLGYLFETLHLPILANVIAEKLANKQLNWVNLSPNVPGKGKPRTEKWKIIINTDIELDI